MGALEPSASRDVHSGSSRDIHTPTSRSSADDPLLEFMSEQPDPPQSRPEPRPSVFVIVPAELSTNLKADWPARGHRPTYWALWKKGARAASRALSNRVSMLESGVRRVIVESLFGTLARLRRVAVESLFWILARLRFAVESLLGILARLRLAVQSLFGAFARLRRIAVESLDEAHERGGSAVKQTVSRVRHFAARPVPMTIPLLGGFAMVAVFAGMTWPGRVEVPSTATFDVDSQPPAATEPRIAPTFAASQAAAPAARVRGTLPTVTRPQPSVKVANLLGTDSRRSPAATASRVEPTIARQGAAPARFRGTLRVASQPRGARVFINGQPVGTTPLVLRRLPIGSRAVRIEADGYQSWSGSVRVVANQETPVNSILNPLTR